ncbi:MAG: hypothetical protein K8T10_15895 [Candidatus Eremiobacteraeota bacterium]|nr:hypothetical protein [Candidatus Eremiobacteraeota bacterium]
MNLYKQILEKAKLSKPIIAIALKKVDQEILEILTQSKEYADIVIAGTKVSGYENYPKITAQDMSSMLISGEVDGIVHWNFGKQKIINALENQYMEKVLRLNLMHFNNHYFFIGPLRTTGIDNMIFKLSILQLAVSLMKDLAIEPKVAIFYCLEKYLGEDPNVDRIIFEGNYLTSFLSKENINAKSYGDKVKEALDHGRNILFAHNWTGAYLMGGTFFSAGADLIAQPALTERIFVSATGRLGPKTYLNALKFACALVNIKKEKQKG